MTWMVLRRAGVVAICAAACAPGVSPSDDADGSAAESTSAANETTSGGGPMPCQGTDCSNEGEVGSCTTDLGLTFAEVPVEGVGAIEQVFLVDANGDDDEDLAIVRDQELRLFHGPDLTDPIVAYTADQPELRAVVPGFFNDDSDLDFALFGDGTLRLLAADPDEGFVEAFSLSELGPWTKLQRARWSFGDDIVVHRPDGSIEVFQFDEALTTAGSYSTPVDFVDIVVDDFAGNGIDELVTVFEQVLLVYGEAENEWQPIDMLVPMSPDLEGIVAGRFHGGDVPLALVYRSTPAGGLWLEGLNREVSYFPDLFPSTADHVTVGDLDGDGPEELVVVADDTVVVAMGDGSDRLFSCYHAIGAAITPTTLTAGDLDGDGRDEVVLADETTVFVLSAS